MLVLSRKEDQKVAIPGLGISIKVVRCKKSSVTLGFEAPAEIRIVRDELDKNGISLKDPSFIKFMEDKVKSYSDQRQHHVRDQFNVVAMAMQMLLDDIESGELSNIDEVFDSVCQRLQGLKSTANDDNAFVLVVEDQANERELLAGLLRMNGYKVATAGNGNEALEYIADQGVPEFVVVDMNMPVCNGTELVRQIRASEGLKDIRVYVVSGSKEEECGLAAYHVDGWYTKPLVPQKLISALAIPNA